MSRLVPVLVVGLLAAAVTSAATAAPPPQATVTRVVDGDSLWLQPASGAALHVRLQGIDAPELCQAWGPQAREALRETLQGKTVTLKTAGRDSYGRVLATLTLDGVNVNQLQVAEGHAWSERVKWDRGPYVPYERMAKSLGRGLHAGGGAVMPKEFRRQHGPCSGSADVAPAPPTPQAARSTAPPALAPVRPARCDGRTRCSQMRSCEEATFFLRHCPTVEMDGDGDGIPCERQWCF